MTYFPFWVTSTSGGSAYYTWNVVTGASQAMASANGYIPNNTSLVTLTLPTTASVGDRMEVVGLGAGGWIIAQNAGQTIHFGNKNTTTGTGGSLASQAVCDCVELVCITTDTDWGVKSSNGSLTVT